MPKILVKSEERRRCGYKKPGGFYLTSDGPATACGRLPLPLDPCEHCGLTLEHTRDFQWVPPQFARHLADAHPCDLENELLVNYAGRGKKSLAMPFSKCDMCPMNNIPEKLGLIWIGEQFYGTPREFLAEAHEMGISRRITKIPRNFVLGETWVWLAHPKCIRVDLPAKGEKPNRWQQQLLDLREQEHTDPKVSQRTEVLWIPAVFSMVKPKALEYVVKGTEPEEELQDLADRGVTLVKIKKIGDTDSLFGEESVEDEIIGNEIDDLLGDVEIDKGRQREIHKLQLAALREQYEKMKNQQDGRKAKGIARLKARIQKLEKVLGVEEQGA